MLDAGCWMLDAGCWMLDAGCGEIVNLLFMMSSGGWVDPASPYGLRRDESSIEYPVSSIR
jgi:hypothetical protein